MSLRQLLTYAHEDPAVDALAEASRTAPQRAFVSASLRPVPAGLAARRRARAAGAGGGRRRPRGARPGRRHEAVPHAAAGAPLSRPRGAVRVPPGAAAAPGRPADRRARRAAGARPERAPPWWWRAPCALAEKVPDPELRPHGFPIEKGGLLDLEETAAQLVACGYERVDQVEERGQFALRGDIVDIYPATEERAVRCELFDVEVERLTFFSTFTQRSLEEVEQVAIEPAAELGPEHRELAEIAAAATEEDERPDVAELLPVDRFGEVLDLLPDDGAGGGGRGGGAGSRRCATYWEDVTTSFHDADAHHLYVSPEQLSDGARAARGPARCRASRATSHTSSAPRPPTPPRARCATPSPSWRSSCARATARSWPGRAGARPSAPPTTSTGSRPPSSTAGRRRIGAGPGLRRGRACARASCRPQLKLAIIPEHRLLRRRRAERPAGPRTGRGGGGQLHRPARGLAGGARGPRHRPVHGLRDQDRGRRHARLPGAGVPRRRPRVRALATSSTRSAATWAPTPATRRCPSSAASSGSSRSCAPAARPRRWPAS